LPQSDPIPPRVLGHVRNCVHCWWVVGGLMAQAAAWTDAKDFPKSAMHPFAESSGVDTAALPFPLAPDRVMNRTDATDLSAGSPDILSAARTRCSSLSCWKRSRSVGCSHVPRIRFCCSDPVGLWCFFAVGRENLNGPVSAGLCADPYVAGNFRKNRNYGPLLNNRPKDAPVLRSPMHSLAETLALPALGQEAGKSSSLSPPAARRRWPPAGARGASAPGTAT